MDYRELNELECRADIERFCRGQITWRTWWKLRRAYRKMNTTPAR